MQKVTCGVCLDACFLNPSTPALKSLCARREHAPAPCMPVGQQYRGVQGSHPEHGWCMLEQAGSLTSANSGRATCDPAAARASAAAASAAAARASAPAAAACASAASTAAAAAASRTAASSASASAVRACETEALTKGRPALTLCAGVGGGKCAGMLLLESELSYSDVHPPAPMPEHW